MNGDGVFEILSDSENENDVVQAEIDAMENSDNHETFVPLKRRDFRILIVGKPESEPRPTSLAWMSKKTNKLRKATFNTKKAKKNAFCKAAKEQIKADHGVQDDAFPIYDKNEAVSIKIIFMRPPPKDQHRGFRALAMNPARVADTKRPDIDNLTKFVMDSLQGVAYSDDKQVVSLVAEKQVDSIPPFTGRTLVEFELHNSENFKSIVDHVALEDVDPEIIPDIINDSWREMRRQANNQHHEYGLVEENVVDHDTLYRQAQRLYDILREANGLI